MLASNLHSTNLLNQPAPSPHAASSSHHEERWPHAASGYDVFEEIGTGAFAIVYRAIVRHSGEAVAIKIMDLESLDTSWDEVRREISTMSFLHHDNVVPIHTSFVHERDLWLVMPLLEGGSCASIMKKIAPKGFKDESLIVSILFDTLKGLHYLHSDGRIHRDVKAGNILIGADGRVQLGDFGVATTLLENGDRKKNRSTFTGTPCWMAPEVMEHGTDGYDEKADIWSFGITALELAFGRAPYSKFQPMKVMLLTLQEEPPTCEIYNDNSYHFSKNFKSLVAKCLSKNPANRPNSKKLMQHKIFKDINKDNKDKAYVKLHTIDKIPPRSNSTKVNNKPGFIRDGEGNAASSSAAAAGSDEGGGKNKPISVGSFVFTTDEFEDFKRKNSEAVKADYKQLYAHTATLPASSPTPNDDDDANDFPLSPKPPTINSSSSSSSSSSLLLSSSSASSSSSSSAHHQHEHHHEQHQPQQQQSADDDISAPVFHSSEQVVGKFTISDD